MLPGYTIGCTSHATRVIAQSLLLFPEGERNLCAESPPFFGRIRERQAQRGAFYPLLLVRKDGITRRVLSSFLGKTVGKSAEKGDYSCPGMSETHVKQGVELSVALLRCLFQNCPRVIFSSQVYARISQDEAGGALCAT